MAPAQGPDVQVVDFVDTFDCEDCAGDLFNAQFARAAFQKDMGRLAKDTDAGPQHQNADGQAKQRIDPAQARKVDCDGAADDGDVGQSVAEIVHQDAAEI